MKTLLFKTLALLAAVSIGCKPNPTDPQLLLTAAEAGDVALLKKYISSGGDVNIKFGGNRQESGRTALHVAAEEKHVAALRVLLDAGADQDAQDDRGATPLVRAVKAGSSAGVDLLLARGADPNKADKAGWGPVMWAAVAVQKDILVLLLDKGAQYAVQDQAGNTPLHNLLDKSVKLGNDKEPWVDLAHELLERGADPTVPNKAGIRFSEMPQVKASARLQDALAKRSRSESGK